MFLCHLLNMVFRRRLILDIQTLGREPTSKQTADVFTHRTQLSRRITALREVQFTFLPAAAAAIATLCNHRDKNGDPVPFPHAEQTPIIFPSDLAAHARNANLAKSELWLRDAQCRTSLDALRNQLIIKARLISYKSLQARHQGATTRMRGLLNRNEKKINAIAAQYRAARAAKIRLVGQDMVGWQALEKVDIRCMQSEPSKLKRKRGEKQGPSNKQTVSWIWMGGDASGFKTDKALHDGLSSFVFVSVANSISALRVEWCQAYARVQRWKEEIVLLTKEMRRTIVSLEWAANLWESRQNMAEFSGPRAEGAKAYAARQAAQFRAMAARFQAEWSQQRKGRCGEQMGNAESLDDSDLEPPDDEAIEGEEEEEE